MLGRILTPLASLKLTIALLSLSMVLVFVGTLAQIDEGIWQVQRKYFHSLLVWVPLSVPLRGWTGGGSFPMPGGYLLGSLLLVNLLAAHTQRWKFTWKDVLLLPLLGLMLAPLIMWQQDGGLTYVSLGIALALPFVGAVFAFHGKRGGIILIHLGLVMLLAGEGISSRLQRESQMLIEEGSYANYSYDIRSAELALVDTSDVEHNTHVTVAARVLRPGARIDDPRLPVVLRVDDYFENSAILGPRQAGARPGRATAGDFKELTAVRRPPVPGTAGAEVDMPSAYVTLFSRDGRELGTYLVSTQLEGPQRVEVDGRAWEMELRFRRHYKPYTMHLIRFVHERYTGTNVPRDYSSHVRLVDPTRNEDRRIRIWMNNPLRYRGETFYQASFIGEDTTVLQVVSNPAVVLPYVACAIGGLGLIAHFLISLAGFLERRLNRPVAAPPPPGPAYVLPPRGGGPLAAILPASALLIALLAVAAPMLRRPAPAEGIDIAALGRLPLSFDGRTKPFDSVARDALKVISGRRSLRHEDQVVQPMQWLLDVMARTPAAREYKVFRIDHPDLKSLLGLDPDRRYFSLMELEPRGADLEAQFNQVAQMPRNAPRSNYQRAVYSLGAHVILFQTLASPEQLHVQPPMRPGEDWSTIAHAFHAGFDPDRPAPAPAAILNAIEAWRARDATAFAQAAAIYSAITAQATPEAHARAALEAWLNRVDLFRMCLVLYATVFLLAAVSWLAAPQALGRAAFALLCLALALHSGALLARIYLSGRAPVTNLESSALFIGWAIVVMGIVLELIYRNALAMAVSAVLGFVTLTIFVNLVRDDSMKVLQAVLDTNFWLWTHVPAITVGYAATFLAGALGVTYIMLGLFTRLLRGELEKILTRMIYGVTCFAILFSFVGTVLGGIWADQSWGRFWGWDPKENGAVLIVLANALLLHARWAGLVRGRGMAVLAVFGNIVTAWSWFGTNMMGVGLHSYGFMDKAAIVMWAFVSSQLLLIGLGLLPRDMWRSLQSETHTPAARSRADFA